MKKILRDKANFDILEGFLSALLKEDITVEEILESESNKDAEKQKFNRVDILVKDKKDHRFIIEVQAETESDYLERLLFGTCKTVVDNLKIGHSFKEIKKVISISIMYFNLGSGQDYLYHGQTEFKGVHTGEILIVKQLTKITDENNRVVQVIEPKPYYLIEVERFEDVIKEDIDEWIYFFKNEEIKDDFHSKNIQKAREKLKLMIMSEKERKAYEKYLMLLASEKDAIETARAEGQVEGEKIGEKRGEKRGHAKGRIKSKIESIIEALEELGPVPESLVEKIQNQQNIEILKKWFKLALRAKSIEEFTKQIAES
jgi:predicted transposase/invertase (TIGR01784 family)